MSEMIEHQSSLVGESQKAWCIYTDNNVKVWIPKSLCERTIWEHTNHDTFSIPQWLAEEKGII